MFFLTYCITEALCDMTSQYTIVCVYELMLIVTKCIQCNDINIYERIFLNIEVKLG